MNNQELCKWLRVNGCDHAANRIDHLMGEIDGLLMSLSKERVITVPQAMETIKKAMMEDNPSEAESYAHSWHCNIAMMCMDAINDAELEIDKPYERINSHEVGNDAASRFMKLCFDVETK